MRRGQHRVGVVISIARNKGHPVITLWKAACGEAGSTARRRGGVRARSSCRTRRAGIIKAENRFIASEIDVCTDERAEQITEFEASGGRGHSSRSTADGARPN